MLSANFGCAESAFDKITTQEVYITDGGDPGTLESQRIESPYGEVPNTYKHERIHVKPIMGEGGCIRILDHRNFPACTTVACAMVEVEPGTIYQCHDAGGITSLSCMTNSKELEK